MYYLSTMEDRIRVPPDMFGSKLEDAVLRLLRGRLEGHIYKDIGIVLSINNPKMMTEGMVIPGDSGAYYTVRFDAMTFMPYINEVYLAEVKEIIDFGAFVSIGPFQGLLHVSQIGKDKYLYDKKNKSFSSRTAKRTVKKGDLLYVKVSTVSLKSSSADTKIGLTMRPDGLGKLDWTTEEKKPAKKEKAAENKGGNAK